MTINDIIKIVNIELKEKTPLNEIGNIPIYCLLDNQLIELNSATLWVDKDGKCVILGGKSKKS